MKSTLSRGLLIVFSFGVLAFIVFFVIDFLARPGKPLSRLLFNTEQLAIPIAIGITIALVLIAALIARYSMTRRLLGKIPIINWFVGERIAPKSIRGTPGALVEFHDGCYYIAALIGEQKIATSTGEIILFKLYCPSAPIPWSGLPIIFATRERVIPLKISFGEVYQITTSFGRTTREVMEEIET